MFVWFWSVYHNSDKYIVDWYLLDCLLIWSVTNNVTICLFELPCCPSASASQCSHSWWAVRAVHLQCTVRHWRSLHNVLQLWWRFKHLKNCCTSTDNWLDRTGNFSKWTNARIRCCDGMGGSKWQSFSTGNQLLLLLLTSFLFPCHHRIDMHLIVLFHIMMPVRIGS